MARRLLFPILGVAALAVAAALSGTARAAPASPDELLARFQPIVVLDRSERLQPIPADAFVRQSTLEHLGPNGYEPVEPPKSGLPKHGDGWRLDHAACSPGLGLVSLSCYAGDVPPAPVVYGRHATVAGTVVLQYWLFYEFDYWSLQYPATGFVWQAHEGDWEVVTILLDRDRNPAQAGYSQHCGGERREWAAVPKAPGTDHPIVYVGTGSHANLFAPGLHPIDLACYPQQAVDFFRTYGVTPTDVNVPGTMLAAATTTLDRLHETKPRWLRFPGTWGEAQFVHGPPPFDTIEYGTSPVGPAFQPEWGDPLGTIGAYRAG